VPARDLCVAKYMLKPYRNGRDLSTIFMENTFEIEAILAKYLRQEVLSEEELTRLHFWLDTKDGQDLIDQFDDKQWVRAQMARIQSLQDDAVWQKVSAGLEKEGFSPAPYPGPVVGRLRTRRRRSFRKLIVILVLVLAGGAAFWALHRPAGPPSVALSTPIVPAGLPGGDRAVLTLGDGRQIDLDSSANGAVANQGNVKVSKLASGQLAYTVLDGKTTVPAFNTLSTPRAGQFSLVLPDGTKVWLNNASSLRYPISFMGSSREVELIGEGYFEVAKNADMPFKVVVHHSGAGEDGGAIEVLGTSFNVMAYSDEKEERTTLVEGSIRFTRGGSGQVLRPAEQSLVDAKGQARVLPGINVEEVTAWKNGYFHFDHSSLGATMRQLARWYDVEVEYKGVPTEQAFMGKIQRNLPLTVVLKGLENEHIHFQLEGRKLLVLP
jgi:transmembrane sensor